MTTGDYYVAYIDFKIDLFDVHLEEHHDPHHDHPWEHESSDVCPDGEAHECREEG